MSDPRCGVCARPVDGHLTAGLAGHRPKPVMVGPGEQPMILDDMLDVLATRPARVHWQRPAILHPVFVEVANVLREAGYAVCTGVIQGDAYLVARYRLHDEEGAT